MYTASLTNSIATRMGVFAGVCTRYNLLDLREPVKEDLWYVKRTTLVVESYMNSFPVFKVLIKQYSNDRRTVGVKEALEMIQKEAPEFKEARSLEQAHQFSPLPQDFLMVLHDISLIVRNHISQEVQKHIGDLKFEIRYGYLAGDEGYVAMVVKTEQVALVVQVKLKD